jgi:translation initiation factor 1
VFVEKKKFGKQYTVVEGLDEKEINLEQLAKKLKERLACGGTVKDKRIELQGEHRQKTKAILIEAGFAPETIDLR